MAIWIRFPELPIEFYDRAVLKEIGSAIGPVLRIDAYMASSSRGNYARLCVQVDLEKPLINMIRIGKCRQVVLYKGISALCFNCGRLGHTQDKCCYSVKQSEKNGEHGDNPKGQEVSQETQSNPNYRLWMLVTRRRNFACNGRGSMQVKGVSSLERRKGKAKFPAVDVDVTTKSPFGILEANVCNPAREDGTTHVLGERVFYAEHDTLSPQACQRGFFS